MTVLPPSCSFELSSGGVSGRYISVREQYLQILQETHKTLVNKIFVALISTHGINIYGLTVLQYVFLKAFMHTFISLCTHDQVKKKHKIIYPCSYRKW